MANQMAKKNYSHQYPVASELWSIFDPNQTSGSTSSTGLIHSLTTPLKQISSFEDIITMVRSHVGSATPPSVMVLYFYESSPSFLHDVVPARVIRRKHSLLSQYFL